MSATDNPRKAIVVTGIAGRFGRSVCRVLHRQNPVVGVDTRSFTERPSDVEHHELDLRSKRLRDLLRRGDIAGVVHLGVPHDPRLQPEDSHAKNLLSIQNLFECIEQFSIPKVVVLSSANVYGPRPDNPQFLDESAPLLAAGRFSEIRDLVEIDLAAQNFYWRNPQIEAVILRPAHILGTVHNPPSNYLRLKRIPTLMGFDPMIQVVHQDDVAEAIRLALAPGIRGIFNLAGPPPVAVSRAVELLPGRTALPVPHVAARSVLNRLFRWGVTAFPAPELDFIRYVCMVDDGLARRTLGYVARHDLRATLNAVDDERWPE